MSGGGVHRHWERQAQAYGDKPEASWADRLMIGLEIEALGAYLQDGHRVLDAGCGNGYSALQQVQRKKIRLTGIDFSASMVDSANRSARKQGVPAARARFVRADLRNLPFEDGVFDRVYTTRSLINLPRWQDQKRAIQECLRVTRSGGKVLFSEAFIEPMRLLNHLRALKKLPPLREPDFNLYLRRAPFENFLRAQKYRFYADDFSSVYYLGTRFLRECVVPVPTDHASPFNQAFAALEKQFSGGDFGIQRLYIVDRP